MFNDPRMDMSFIKTWDSKETHCAKVAISRNERMKKLKEENAIIRAQLAEKDKQLAAADICDGCNYKNTVGCHCARAKWRGPQEAGEVEQC